ncbi:DoxX family protein [Edaphobacter albus]|uniref:DoxX family protein n=1 Tax=Edaphobacter sp. 4G125 TaxID=2763071 RepID=UPI00164545FC|nr:DoxX family protein [Edaphobacter sp. 4G125]QNI37433.1 DoxX family protein [Edaphobacter sp. 4G125]
MKIAVLIARILLGLIFTVFGLNTFFHFLPMQLPPGDAGTLMGIMFKYGWFTFIGILYVIAGVLLLIGRYIGVALTILGPIIVIILLYHITMDPKDIGPGLFAALLEIFLIYAHWHHFDDVWLSGKNPSTGV